MIKLLKISIILFMLGAFVVNAKAPTEKWVKIPAGNFYPFFSDTVRPVKVDAFTMMDRQVTNAEFLDFVKKNPEWQRSKIKRIFAEKSYLKYWKSDTVLGENVNPNAPVVMVSWFAAKAYCKWKGGRLANIAEWEYVASANKKAINQYGDKDFSSKILVMYERMPKMPLPDVGERFKNYFGVYDMHGLVWEWTLDFNSVMISNDSRAKSNVDGGLFCAAGSIGNVNPTNYAAFMRYSIWSSLKAQYCLKNLGFRCIK